MTAESPQDQIIDAEFEPVPGAVAPEIGRPEPITINMPEPQAAPDGLELVDKEQVRQDRIQEVRAALNNLDESKIAQNFAGQREFAKKLDESVPRNPQ